MRSACLALGGLLLGGLAGVSDAWAQNPIESVTRPGSGDPVCGLGRDFHEGRRAALCEQLERGVVLIRGLPVPRDYLRFHQDKTFWYLTGIDAPDLELVIVVETGEAILFAPERNAYGEAWHGEIWDTADAWIPELTGIDEVRHRSELLASLEDWTRDGGPIWINERPWLAWGAGTDTAQPFNARRESDPLDGRVSREEALRQQLETRFEVPVRDAGRVLVELRAIKQPEEIAALKRAAVSGARAMVEAIRSTAPGRGEWEIEALMTLIQIQQGAMGPAYHAIVGSGPNSCVLHYSNSNRRMRDNEILLIDYGSEFDFYATDITRTWPVNGQFTERQAELYDIVLEAQTAAIDAARPGNSMLDIQRACREVFERHEVNHLAMHGPTHFIGLEVHDVGGRTFEPGMALAIEPGLYSIEESLGVRIEDVVVITEDGCEVITRDVPVGRSEIEALIREVGVLDRLENLSGGAPAR